MKQSRQISRLIWAFFASIGCLAVPGVSLSEEGLTREEMQKLSIDTWNKYLAKKVSIGDSLKSCDELLKGKFRERCKWSMGGTGHQYICYGIDDLIDVWIPLDHLNDVSGVAMALPRGVWIRQPNGDMYVVYSLKSPSDQKTSK